ncbi:MAG: ABC transporter permease [Acidobacteria bacterium]|nr:ABC transporter permease [Acidobacteriota bacterium]MBI3281597.1 ABC transporter permease [Acidobacteriota bacterium]
MAHSFSATWSGDYRFLLTNLLLKDFRVRYRNMSLGFGWSVASPLVMMAVLTFIFTWIFPTGQPHFPAFVLCGLVPFNFFATSWVMGTVSLVGNAHLIKRTRFPREIIPVSTVLANCIHFAIQIALLLALVLLSGFSPSRNWLWIPVVAGFELVFVCGLAVMFSALDVYVRDMHYIVESANTVLFWMVPIFYSFTIIPERFHELYRFNPVAAVVMAFRNVLLDGRAPADTLLWRLAFVSSLTFGIGLLVFRGLKRRFYDYL